MTTINPPTDAVRAIAGNSRYELVVVGDLKTPAGWSHPDVRYYSVEDQRATGFRSADSVPSNHYSRKNLGYLIAMRDGAEFVADTDDDNIPYGTWEWPPFNGRYTACSGELGPVNVYTYFTDDFVWPRGVPLDRIRKGVSAHLEAPTVQECSVWQGVVDGDPDVDAVYRLIIGNLCKFREAPPLVIGAGTYSPTNSQNALHSRDAFPLLYLPTTVSFRFTDILRGLVAQVVLWRFGRQVGFCGPNAEQIRNEHNLIRDFEQEVPMYLQTDDALAAVRDAVIPAVDMSDAMRLSYEALADRGIVDQQELESLEDWRRDVGLALGDR